jgi:hypothetical protein
MKTVTLKIKDKSKFQHFLTFIEDLDYIEVLKQKSDTKKSATSEDNFFALAGMWKNRDISAEDLRSKAWPTRK